MTRLALVALLVTLVACSAHARPPAEQRPRCEVGGPGDVQAQVCACFETEGGLECPAPPALQGTE